MGHHHDGHTRPVQLLKKIHDSFRSGGIQRPGRLVRQQHCRIIHNGSGDGHPLLLPAGHGSRHLPRICLHLHLFQCLQSQCFLSVDLLCGEIQRQQHIFHGGKLLHQGKILQHDSDLLIADPGHLPVPGRLHLLSVQLIIPAVQGIQAAQDMQQGGFSAAGFSHHGHQLPRPDFTGNTRQRFQLIFFSFVIDFLHIHASDHWFLFFHNTFPRFCF